MAEIGSLAVRLGLDDKEFKAGLKDAERQTENFGDNIKNLGAVIGIAFGVSELAQFTKDLYLLNETAHGVTKTFQSFGNSRQLMEDLRTATGGMVSELALMKTAVSAKNFKIPLEDLSKLLRFATIRAAETGQSVDYLAESIVLGISRKSIPILDNLGLSATEIQKEFAKTGDFAKAVGNIIDQDLGNSALTIDDATRKSAQLAAQWEDFKLILSDFTSGPGSELVSFLSDSLYLMGRLTKEVSAVTDGIDGFAKQLIPLQAKIALAGFQGLVMYLKETEKITSNLASSLFFQAQTSDQNEPFLFSSNTIDTLAEVNEQLRSLAEKQLTATGQELANVNQEMKRLNELAEELKNKGLGTGSGRMEKTPIPGTAPTGMGQGIWSAPEADLSKIQAVNVALAEMDGWGNRLTMTFENLEGVFVNMNNIMMAVGTETLTGFAEGLGSAIAGVNNFGDSILNAISGFMATFGKQLIALGVAKSGLDQLFKAGPVGAGIAIAAGVALVAAASAVNASAQSAVGNIGSGGSSGGGRMGGGTSGANGLLYGDIARQVKAIDLSGTFVIRGEDLVRIIEKQNYNKGFTG